MALADLSTEDFHDTVKAYFTDDEWDAIFTAVCEYQDYGQEEAEMSSVLQSKISKLFQES